jgi:hypothetical protein
MASFYGLPERCRISQLKFGSELMLRKGGSLESNDIINNGFNPFIIMANVKSIADELLVQSKRAKSTHFSAASLLQKFSTVSEEEIQQQQSLMLSTPVKRVTLRSKDEMSARQVKRHANYIYEVSCALFPNASTDQMEVLMKKASHTATKKSQKRKIDETGWFDTIPAADYLDHSPGENTFNGAGSTTASASNYSVCSC